MLILGVEDRVDSLHTNFHQITLNGQNTLNSFWSFDELIGYSDSRFANPVQTTLGWDQYDQTVVLQLWLTPGFHT